MFKFFYILSGVCIILTCAAVFVAAVGTMIDSPDRHLRGTCGAVLVFSLWVLWFVAQSMGLTKGAL